MNRRENMSDKKSEHPLFKFLEEYQDIINPLRTKSKKFYLPSQPDMNAMITRLKPLKYGRLPHSINFLIYVHEDDNDWYNRYIQEFMFQEPRYVHTSTEGPFRDEEHSEILIYRVWFKHLS